MSESPGLSHVRTAQNLQLSQQRSAQKSLATSAAAETKTEQDLLAQAAYNYQAGINGVATAAQTYLDNLAQAQHDQAIALAQDAYNAAARGDYQGDTSAIEQPYDNLIAGYENTYRSAATTAETARSTTEANGLYTFRTHLAALVQGAQNNSAQAALDFDTAAAREYASISGATALVDKNFRTDSSSSQKTLAQSLATSAASPWSTHYAALWVASDSFEAAAAPAFQARQIAIANADSGVTDAGTSSGSAFAAPTYSVQQYAAAALAPSGSSGSTATQSSTAPSGGGRIAIAGEVRLRQQTATDNQFAQALTEANAALAATLAQQPGTPTLPVLEAVTIEPSTAGQPPLVRPLWESGLLTASPLSRPASPAVPDNPVSAALAKVGLPQNFELVTDQRPADAPKIQVEDARESLIQRFGQSPAPTTLIEVLLPNGLPTIAVESPLDGLPEGFKVDTRWTEAEIARVALALALGGKAGPLSAAQEAQYARYKAAIESRQGTERAREMQYGQRRDTMTAELHRHWRLDNPPSYDPAFNALGIPLAIPGDPPPNFSALTYAELAAEFEKKLPSGTNVENWITEKIAQDYLDWLDARIGKFSAYEDSQRVMLDLVQLGFDIGGVFDPTPITDGINAGISVLRLQIVDAGINTVSMLPWVGDSLKLLKISHYVETLATAAWLFTAKYPQFAFAAAAISERISHVLARVNLEELPGKWRQAFQKLRDQAATTASRLIEAVPLIEKFDFNKHLRDLIGDPPPGMKNAHAHHILFKKGLDSVQERTWSGTTGLR